LESFKIIELADMCDIPHSSVARIESGKSTPNLRTLLKIFKELNLNLVAEPAVSSPHREESL
jgi:transcriptional regulator with XRE-family HTH domain